MLAQKTVALVPLAPNHGSAFVRGVAIALRVPYTADSALTAWNSYAITALAPVPTLVTAPL